MNIIYMHTHDTGTYIEPYGHHIPTPNLMNLAREGLLFRNAFSVAPTCSASRSGLLTGMMPHQNGMLGLAHKGFKLNDYNKHIADILNTKDYETTLCGIQHVGNSKGYKRNISTNDDFNLSDRWQRDRINAEKVADYLYEKGRSRDKFFLSFGMINTHRPFADAKQLNVDPDNVLPPAPIFDCPDTRKDMADFIASAKEMDSCVGIVLKALKESNLANNTMVIFTTDHGLAFPFMKSTLYDSGINVSLIIRYPGAPNNGTITDSLVSHLDIYPTICEAANVEVPSWAMGRSLIPLIQGEEEKIRDEIYAESNFHGSYQPTRCVRTERYKYIKYFDEKDLVSQNTDGGYSKSFLSKCDYYSRKTRDNELLFDLYFDPNERENLIDNPEYKDVYQEMKEKLRLWMEQTDDMLLKGPIPKEEMDYR